MSTAPDTCQRPLLRKTSGLVVGALLATVLLASLAAQESLPTATGFINDYVGVLDVQTRTTLEILAQELQGKTGAEVAVAVLGTLGGESLEDYTVRVAEHWGVGDRDDRGVLLLLAIEDRALRIEVGYGLEGVIPDGFAGSIRDEMTPVLRQGDYDRAIAIGFGLLASAIARDAGVTLSGMPPRSTRRERRRGIGGWLPLLLLVPLLFVRRRRGVGGWHDGRMSAAWLLAGMSAGSLGGHSRGGGISSGGFGGFGGGGFGGGGASGGW